MRRAAVAAGVLVALLVVAQLVMPGVAERKLRSDLQDHGRDVHVDVAAFPAVKLLWHKADRVTVDVGDYRPRPSRSGSSLADQLASTKDAGELDVRVGRLHDRLLRMHDVSLRKDGDVLRGQVRLRRADVNAALPPQLHLSAHALSGEGIAVAGVTSAFGRRVNARARILVDARGRIVLKPEGIPLAALVTVPLFADDRVAVDAIAARPTAGGFMVAARGHLR
ncbi:MAG TPA: hypothetical protein VI318_14835 [Baekduia sp.]